MLNSKDKFSHEEGVLLILLFILIYKKLLGIFIGELAIQLVFLLCFLIATLFFSTKLLNRKIIANTDNLIVFFLLFWLCFLFVISLFTRPPRVEVANVFISFRQIFVPLILVLIVLNTQISKCFLKGVILFSIPVLLFSILEWLLPTSVIKTTYNSVMPIGAEPFEQSAYFFWEFGSHPIRRIGSLFFEPLTYAIFTAYIIVTLIVLRRPKVYIGVYLLMGLASLVKSFYIFISVLIFSNNRIRSTIVIFSFFICALGIVLYSFGLSEEQLKEEFFTIGNHFYGLVSGLVNGVHVPLLGHGLGTANYLNVLQNIQNGNEFSIEIVNAYFNDPYAGNGNESGLGVMLYQFGVVFSFFWGLLYFVIILKLLKARLFVLSSMFLSYIIVFTLSESVYAVLLLVYPFVLYSYAYRRGLSK